MAGVLSTKGRRLYRRAQAAEQAGTTAHLCDFTERNLLGALISHVPQASEEVTVAASSAAKGT